MKNRLFVFSVIFFVFSGCTETEEPAREKIAFVADALKRTVVTDLASLLPITFNSSAYTHLLPEPLLLISQDTKVTVVVDYLLKGVAETFTTDMECKRIKLLIIR